MSNLLHVHIKHEIQYGDNGFNWQINGVHDLLNAAGCCIGENGFDGDCTGDWEISETEFQEAIKNIKAMPTSQVAGFFDSDYVSDHSDADKEKFKKYVVDTLQKFADTGDHHNGYYHFSWF